MDKLQRLKGMGGFPELRELLVVFFFFSFLSSFCFFSFFRSARGRLFDGRRVCRPQERDYRRDDGMKENP
jgi:hypothetical protein